MNQLKVQGYILVVIDSVGSVRWKQILKLSVGKPAVTRINEIGMSLGDHGGCNLLPCHCNNLDIEFLTNAFLQANVDLVSGDECLSFFERLGREVTKHLELIRTLAYEGAQRDCNGKAGHPGSRYADSHGVFQDIRAQIGRYLLRAAAQLFNGTRRTQCNRHGLRTSDRRHNFFMDKRNDALTDGFVNHIFHSIIHTFIQSLRPDESGGRKHVQASKKLLRPLSADSRC